MSHKEWRWFKETLHRIADSLHELGQRIVILGERNEATDREVRELLRLATKDRKADRAFAPEG